MWTLNNTFINIQRVKEEITWEIRKQYEINVNENIAH